MKKFFGKLKRFFFPPQGSPRWRLILPYVALGILTILLLIGGAYGWQYTNSPQFCGTTCHTMPPEYAAYQVSPHAQVACVECHIGREFIGNQIVRKVGDIKHVVDLAFKDYEFPIYAGNMRPASFSCERCHSPEKFSDDTLKVISHYGNDKDNTPYSTYLVLKTGGGSKRKGLGRGIHWHIENEVYYYAADTHEQVIPYVRVVNDDGSVNEYVDIEANLDPASIEEDQLRKMDCITCHNRITHRIYTPDESMDSALEHKVIASDIPEIRRKGVEALSGDYATQESGLKGIAALSDYYKTNYPDYYAENADKVDAAIAEIQQIYVNSVFIDQKVNWDTHPRNIGHVDGPGCFRCHDGKHLNGNDEAIRLECNLCHSIPVVAGPNDFLTNIEINRGIEPEMHLNPNWISMHHEVIDATCSNCHTTEDMGGTSNTSFCSNSACHGSTMTYSGFDAPSLREIIRDQLPTPMPTPTPPPTPVSGPPTYAANIQPLFNNLCSLCHGPVASAGLNLLTYAGVVKGSDNGPVIIPGDSENSRLVQIQSEQHFANLSAEQLGMVIEWIDAGAPEK